MSFPEMEAYKFLYFGSTTSALICDSRIDPSLTLHALSRVEGFGVTTFTIVSDTWQTELSQ